MMDYIRESVCTTTLVLTTLAVSVVALWMWLQRKPSRNFPPGPKGWPIVGNLLDSKKALQLVFMDLAETYGDVFSFRLGPTWAVILNSQDSIKEAFLKKGADFAGRPYIYSMELFTEGGKDIANAQYTPTWKLHRKLAYTAFRKFASGNNERFENMLFSVTPNVEKAVEEYEGKPFDPKQIISLAIYNFQSTMCFGKQYTFDDPELKEWMALAKQGLEEVGSGIAADFIPIMRFIPTSGIRTLKHLVARYKAIIYKEFEAHQESYSGGEPRDIIDLLLQTRKEMEDEGNENLDQITPTHMWLTVADIFSGGTDSSVITIQWAIALLLDHPEIQAKVAEELDRVIGRDRLPSLDDRGTVPYSESTLYEVLRYSSAAAVGQPHATTVDTSLRGYDIPKGTMVISNLYALHYDKKYWVDPENFKPEHFLNESGTMRTHPDSFLPFSIGRRVCLGEALAKAELFLLFTWLFHRFEFTKPPGKENEKFAETMPVVMASIIKDFECVVKRRF